MKRAISTLGGISLLFATAATQAIVVNENFSGNWSDANGRGIIVDIIDNPSVPNGKLVLFQWFTHAGSASASANKATEPGDRIWYVGAGPIDRNIATFDVGFFDGGDFGSDFPGFAPGDVNVAGTVSVTFNGCDEIVVDTAGNFDQGQDSFSFSPVAFDGDSECIIDAFSGCPSFSTPSAAPGACEITGTFTDPVINLTNDIEWVLDGQVFFGTVSQPGGEGTEIQVDASVDLHIEAGTKIVGKGVGDAMIISPGSRLFANGSARNPIIMTSPFDTGNPSPGFEPAPGDWGGLFIRGLGITNGCGGATPCVQVDEALLLPYGGDNFFDDSGNISHLQLMYGGFEFRPDEELNGITLAGVGAGTSMDNLVVFQGLDDGVEYFGGAARISNLGLFDVRDDSFDTCCGAEPVVQHLYVIQGSGNGDHGWEADNVGGVPDEMPLTNVLLANATFRGAGGEGQGNKQRRGANAKVYNSTIFGFGEECLNVDDQDTFDDFVSGDLLYNNTVIGSCGLGAFTTDFDVAGIFAGQSAGNFVNENINYDGICPPEGSPLYSAGGFVDIANLQQTSYAGVCAHPNDNRFGWAGNLVEWTIAN